MDFFFIIYISRQSEPGVELDIMNIATQKGMEVTPRVIAVEIQASLNAITGSLRSKLN